MSSIIKTKVFEYLVERLERKLKEEVHEHMLSADGEVYKNLLASECVLIQSYNYSIPEGGDLPPIDVECSIEDGTFDHGPVLFWLNNPDELPSFLRSAAKLAVTALELIENAPLPASRITIEDYENIKQQTLGGGIVGSDGTIFGFGTYEQLDTGWITSLVYFLYYQLDPDNIHAFNNTPAKPIKLKSSSQSAADGRESVSIVVVGDWGTGKYTPGNQINGDGPAVAVMGAIEKIQPDYIVHLGDVYYAGTEGIIETFGEEDEKLMDCWPKDRFEDQDRGSTCFTMNSNHEMYDGANGYFNVALSQKNTPFSAQEKASFFALEFDPWVIVGFDSAYYSSPKQLFMHGSLGEGESAQMKWCKELYGDKKGKNVIVMSHHNGVNETGEEYDGPLGPSPIDGKQRGVYWNQVCSAVNGVPDYWYWGHIHLGVVYDQKLPLAQGANLRCCGNGAIPNGEPWACEGVPHIQYYCKTRVNDDGPRVRNGFSLITLYSDGGIDEAFYEVEDGTTKPILMWQHSGDASS
ncbi:MAG: metallophosphoesterase [Pseudomonadota bacterium]